MKRHFVRFYSPGTFVAEQTELPIEAWDVDLAKEMAKSVKERHGATPYGFMFITRGREESDMDSHVIAESGMYYLGGTVYTLAEVEARAIPDENILLSNMKINGWNRIITNTNSWKWTQPLNDDDVVLEWKP